MLATFFALVGLSVAPLAAIGGAAPATEMTAASNPIDQFQALEPVFRAIGKRLLSSESEEAFLAGVDAELLDSEPLSLLLSATLQSDLRDLADAVDGLSRELDSVIDDLVAVTSPRLREELAQGLVGARHLMRLVGGHRAAVEQLRETIDRRPAVMTSAILAELGDHERPLQERHAGLAILRAIPSLFALAAASETRSMMPPWMADLVITLWRQGLEQTLAQIKGGSPPPLRDERLSPISKVLLSYSCGEPELLATAFRKHPTVVPLLLQIADNLPRFFTASPIDHLRLRPSPGAETSPEDVVIVDVFVGEHDPLALAALDRFMDEWWLDASSQTTADIVVDIRRV